MKIPGFNLWNWPTQRELNRINIDNAIARGLKARSRNLKLLQHETDQALLKVENRIKEREFLYYLHSGRFPE